MCYIVSMLPLDVLKAAKEAGLYSSDIARLLDVDQASLCRWLQGKPIGVALGRIITTHPSLLEIYKLIKKEIKCE